MGVQVVGDVHKHLVVKIAVVLMKLRMLKEVMIKKMIKDITCGASTMEMTLSREISTQQTPW